jgi:hypothetical protein
MEASAEPPEVKRTGRNWLDLLLAVSAIFVSMCSLYLAYNSSNAMERLVHASSWPFIQIESGNTEEDRVTPVLSFTAVNAGTGPARVHSFEVLVDGEPLEQPNDILVHLLQACCAEDYAAVIGDGQNPYDVLGTIYTRPVSPRLIAPDREVLAIAWARTELNERLWYALDQARQRGRITARACYCSVFDECWQVESDELPVPHANACEAAWDAGEP